MSFSGWKGSGESNMDGSLIFDPFDDVRVNSRVFIVVDDTKIHGCTKSPRGFWMGKLIEVGQTTEYAECSDTPCTAIITDPEVKKSPTNAKFFNKQPNLPYDAYTPCAAIEFLLRKREEDRREINGLNKRLDIERSVFHGALKAMVSDKGFDKLEALLESFIERLEEKLPR
ncbi:MAG: hypothetical protein WA001_05740 [Patescibacteria group bacterium]